MIEVRAFDKDEEASITTYSIQAGNQGGAFRVEERTGYIRVAKPLDYEAIRRYQLTLRAGDGIFWNEVRRKISWLVAFFKKKFPQSAKKGVFDKFISFKKISNTHIVLLG